MHSTKGSGKVDASAGGSSTAGPIDDCCPRLSIGKVAACSRESVEGAFWETVATPSDSDRVGGRLLSAAKSLMLDILPGSPVEWDRPDSAADIEGSEVRRSVRGVRLPLSLLSTSDSACLAV